MSHSESSLSSAETLVEKKVNWFARSIHRWCRTKDAKLASEAPSSTDSFQTTISNKSTISTLSDYGECFKQIGEGSTATIFITRYAIMKNNIKNYQLYAAKRFRRLTQDESEKTYRMRAIGEFCISSSLRHKNVVETLDLVRDEQGRFHTVMEFCAGGDLFTVLKEMQSTVDRMCCFKQMMQGIAYLHSVGVAHRDIKPENLLLTLEGTLKIGDFGVSDVYRRAWEKTEDASSGKVGTEPYAAPEVLSAAFYAGSMADIWSAGIVFYMIWTGSYIWEVADECKSLTYLNYLLHYPEKTFSKFNDLESPVCRLLYSMIDPTPKTRMTAEGVLKDKWVQSIVICEKGIDALNRDHCHIHIPIFDH